jgi:hypothetical protein
MNTERECREDKRSYWRIFNEKKVRGPRTGIPRKKKHLLGRIRRKRRAHLRNATVPR